MLALPALLFAIGAFLIVVADHALVSSLQRMAHARFQDHANEAHRALAATVAQAEPLLAELAARLGPDGQASVPSKAAVLRALAAGRADVAWISWSTPDGHFVGLQRLPDDVWGVTDQMPQAPGRTLTRRYGFAEDGGLVLREEDPDDTYDPRHRPFWLQAVASAGPVWTRPYAFHEGGAAGVTCALAVRSADGALLGVATVDFSFASLSTLVARLRDQQGGTTLVFTRDREVLAWPGDLPAAVFDRLTRFDDLDPTVARFASQVLEREPDAAAVAFARDDGGELLGAVARLPVGGQEWLIGSYVAMDEITAPAAGFRSRSAAIATGGVVLGVVLAALLARLVARSRRSVAVAQAQAQAAGERVRELGSYRLLRRLGSGGMGEVWVGEHRMLARRAAIKLVLRRALAGRSESEIQVAITRFQREARATASLRSRNTIQVYDFGVSAGGDFYYVMELLEGYDLHALVLDFGPPPLGRIVHLARQVCRSLAEAHDRGLVHRDIKPANIFCSELGGEGDVVKVLDFGMVIAPAVANGRLTSPDMAQGTPSFMAPEQARGLPIDPHADLYALGCVLHVLLTGDDVFPQSHPVAAALAHVNDPPAPLSRRTKRTIPAALERLVMACLAKNPADRPADARVMEAALAAIEIPLDERWDDAAIRAWWQAHPPCRLGVELVAERMDLQPRFVPASRSETEPVGKTPAS